jgi:hypothetical protein
MPFDLHFAPTGLYIDSALNSCSEALVNLINIASQVNVIEFKNLRFKCGKLFDLKSPITLGIIIQCRIPLFDLIVYSNLSDECKSKVVWEIDESRPHFIESQIAFSSLFIYFMLMTRNKALPDRNENIPAFLTKFMSTPMTIDDIKRCLSENNLNLFQHKWIQKINVNVLTPSLKNRLKQGIAGMRLFSIIRDNESDKPIDANLINLVNKIRQLVNDGPFWEMHTLFQSTNLSSASINSNLNNLILEIYSIEKLELLVKNRSLFKLPVFNPRALSYRTWGISFFSEFKSRINFD